MVEGGEVMIECRGLVAMSFSVDGSIAASVTDVGDLGIVVVIVVGRKARCFFGDDGVDGCDGCV